MADFYIERDFATLTAADERALGRRLEACARDYPVRWHKCLIDAARSRIVCHLEAENLSAARAAALCMGVTRENVWLSSAPWADAMRGSVEDHRAAGANHRLTRASHSRTMEQGSPVATSDGLIDVMAEWSLNVPTDALDFARVQNVCNTCLDALRVRPRSVATSPDGRRVVAFLCAPDAESVRHAYRYATVPFDRVIALRQLGR